MACANTPATSDDPTGAFPARALLPTVDDTPVNAYGAPATGQMNAAMIQDSGGGGAHPNMQPFLTVTFCIALVGVYPTRD